MVISSCNHINSNNCKKKENILLARQIGIFRMHIPAYLAHCSRGTDHDWNAEASRSRRVERTGLGLLQQRTEWQEPYNDNGGGQ